ncbi:MAG TPA: hypothetical protein VF432_07470 [Thermoanaerobaculia bacterium]
MKRTIGLLSLGLFLAIPVFARVISYAPYTSRVAVPSIQDRTSRHFVLIEAKAEEFLDAWNREVVLYDSTGAEEPRVITPPGTSGSWSDTALYEKAGRAPMILALKYSQAMFSADATNWQQVEGLDTFFLASVLDVDTGGPFSHGLFAPVVLGNDDWPFVVTLSNGVWAIGRTGEARPLLQTSGARVIGRNAAGDRFLIRHGSTIWTSTVDGTLTKTADLTVGGFFAGWITSGGAAYIERVYASGRQLFLASGGSLTLLADAAPVYVPADEPLPLRAFAVPTHDYEGAWVIERAPDYPTILSRHTPAAGLQRMWIDDDGPQVEALIPGPSGQTVLIQVHRDRESAELQKPIIDPALAVWRIGQPAPRSYDELYLNEEPNKGFVIVNADEIESGATFVFNSGFEAVWRPASRVSAPIGGGGDVTQEWGVVRGSLRQRLVLPGVSRMRGAYDSFWQTDVTIYNPLAEAQQVDVRYVPMGAASAVTATLALAPYEIRAIPDVLRSLFFLESGGGALHLLPAVGVNATARTYSRKDGGTYGFGMHAIDAFTAAGPRFPLTFAGAFPGNHFRTNVTLTDTSGRGTRASLRTRTMWDDDLPAGELDTPAAGTMQSTLAPPDRSHEDVGVALIVEPARGTALATVVAIDNRSNDPTWFPPDVPGTVPRAIPVIGHVDGGHGSQWRSDLYLHNPRDGSRYLILTATPWDRPWQWQTAWVRLNGRETRVVRDALWTLFRLTGVARLRYSSAEDEPGEGVRVTSRTYTVDANGATYGCLVPPLTGFQIGTPGDRLEILGVSAGPGFRTNVGLVDVSDTTTYPSLVRVRIIGDRQQLLDETLVEVPARGGLQLNDIFGMHGITPPPAALLVVDVLDGKQIAAYATLVDNVTNDSIYLGSQLGAKETN